MLAHAFDVLGVHRVVLNTDARNERSRAAIARIGATFEGVLHSYRYGVEGTPRDTATFAITAPIWPAVRTRLEARVTGPTDRPRRSSDDQAFGLMAAASQRPRRPGRTSNSHAGPDRDRAGAVGDRDAVERVDRAVVGGDLAQPAVLVERRDRPRCSRIS